MSEEKTTFGERLEDLIDEFINLTDSARDEVISALELKVAALKEEKAADAA